jgi:hypothetical protein
MTTATHVPTIPTARRPRLPREYGVPSTRKGMLEWGPIEGRLREANAYWVATCGAGGPLVRPVDGIWVEGALYVGGSPETKWVRNLMANPKVSVNLDGGWDVVILEGEAELLETGVDQATAELLAAESNRKYPQYGVRKASDYVGHPAGFAIRPALAFVWKAFPKDVTKFVFQRADSTRVQRRR